jgi:hypothetical protein
MDEVFRMSIWVLYVARKGVLKLVVSMFTERFEHRGNSVNLYLTVTDLCNLK